MFKKLISLGLILIALVAPASAAHATGNGGNVPKSGCALGGKTHPSGTTIHLKDRWGNVLRSWQCFGGKWVPILQA